MDPPADGVQPLLLQCRRVTGMDLVGGGLGLQRHQQVAVVDGSQGHADKGQVHGQAVALLQAGEVQAQHGDIAVARLFQCLAQQEDVVGGPAAAAGLGDDEGSVVQVIFAGLQGIQKLADDQQGGIAGVVMDIFQAQLADLAAAVAQQLHLVALVLHSRRQDAELHGGHVRDEDGVGLLHILGENGIVHLHAVMPPLVFHPARPGRRTGSAGGYAPRQGS